MTHAPVARLRRRVARLTRLDERGVATAEYAVATAAGCGLAAVLIKLLTSDWGEKLLKLLYALIHTYRGPPCGATPRGRGGGGAPPPPPTRGARRGFPAPRLAAPGPSVVPSPPRP